MFEQTEVLFHNPVKYETQLLGTGAHYKRKGQLMPFKANIMKILGFPESLVLFIGQTFLCLNPYCFLLKDYPLNYEFGHFSL